MSQDDEVVAGGAPATTGALVGRERELGLLRQGLDAAVAGRSQLFLVAGEAGIGKSRMADEIARIARHRDLLVVWGRCWEAGGAPAYWPWVQVLRTCLREVPGASARHADVADVLEPAQQRTDAGSTWTDADSARFEQFDAVTTFLLDTARQRPILLLLDDLQSADAPSLLLLRFLAHQLDETPLMVVGTFRREDLSQDRPLTDAVADLTRLPNARRLDLVGLDDPEVARMVEEVTGTRPSPAVAAALLHETAGNPFFVSEISRLASAEGRLEEADPTYWERTIPQGVRQVVGLRVDRLSRECARVLSVASVLGREFRIGDLSRLSGLGLEDLDEVLDEAADSGLIAAEPMRPGLYRFFHAVIRDTLYDELPASHRARLHVQAGEILESAEGDIRSAATAHHYFHAGPRAGVNRIVATARRAGDHALGLLAYEEAVRLYQMAVTALSWGDTDPTTECRLQLSLGDAASRAGAHNETRRSFLRAAELAEAADDAHSFARAALGYGGRSVWLRAAADPKLVPMLERALAVIEDDDLELRARLMARLAGAKRDEVDRTARDTLSAEAVALARRSGDDGLLAYALVGRHAAMLGPLHAPGALGPPDELVAVAARAGNAELRFEGLMHRLVRTMEVGDHAGMLAVADELDRIAGELHQPTHQWFALATRANLALVHGELAGADDLISGAMAVGLRSQTWDAQRFGDIQRFVLRREQARLDEMRERVQASIRTYPTRPLFACMAAVADVELGDDATARAVLEPLAADGFRAVPLNNDWSLSTFLLAEVVHALGDEVRAASLYEVLRPAAGNCVETVEVSVGSIDRALGLLALTTGRVDEAVEHLEIALATNERIGARPWAAHTRLALAKALRQRNGDGDAARAEPELEHALTMSRNLGQIALQQRIEAAAGAGAAATPRAGRATVAARGGVFRSEGDVWVVGLDGAEHRVRATKGLGYVASLLAAPARQIHALDLVGSVGGDARRAGRGAAAELEPARAGGGEEVLDARARAAYRERIEVLQAEIDEAEEWNDSSRASKARGELDFLIEELTAASGLGGRSRSFTSDAERARVNATRAIRAAVSKIGEHDTQLAWHLDRSLRTGTYCSYEPDREAPVDWQLI